MKIAKFFNILTLILLLLTTYTYALNIAELFNKGNKYYKEGNFEKAVGLYREIENSGLRNSKLFFNLGNCYFKMNKLGFAILYYERAKKLSPRDKDIEFNLKFANAMKIDSDPEVMKNPIIEAVKHIMEVIPFVVLRFFLSFLFILTMISWIMYFLKGEAMSKFYRKTGTILIAVLLLVSLVFIYRLNIINSRSNGIVVEKEVEIHSGTGENFTVVYSVHEGLKLKIIKKGADWFQVSLPDGYYGWIKKEFIEIIL